MEEISYQGRKVILDVAHNPAGFLYLNHELKKRYGKAPIRCLFTLSKNKNIQECLKEIGRFTESPIIFKSCHPRLYSADFLCRQAKEMGLHAAICSDIRTLEPDDIIVVCGSFYMMSEIRNQLGIKEISDPIDLTEKLLR